MKLETIICNILARKTTNNHNNNRNMMRIIWIWRVVGRFLGGRISRDLENME